jgi:hypothetical protein
MNYLYGTISGLFLTGSIVGSYTARPYCKKIYEESKTQKLSNKLVSYYGATMTFTGLTLGSGFAFTLAPVIIPIILISNTKYVKSKMEPVDIISLSK